MSSLQGKVIFITGASSGIGAAIAVEFAARGSYVAIAGRNPERLKHTAKLCHNAGLGDEHVCLIIGDISIETDVRRMCQEVLDHFKTVDVIVNNAGSVGQCGVTDLSLQLMDAKYAEFVRSPALISHLLLPELIKNKGNIINMSSVLASVPNHFVLPYCTMKAGMDHMTRCMALELAPHKIRVNTVNPGCVETPIWPSEDEKVEVAFNNNPLERAAQPEEVAKLVVFLASDDAAYITGSSHQIDGGWALTSYLTTLLSKSRTGNK